MNNAKSRRELQTSSLPYNNNSFLEPATMMTICIGTSRISGTNLNTRNQWPLQHQSRGDQRDIISGTSNLRVAMHAHGYFHPAGRRTSSSSCNEDVIIGNMQQTSSTTESLQQRENNEKLDNMQATASLLVGGVEFCGVPVCFCKRRTSASHYHHDQKARITMQCNNTYKT